MALNLSAQDISKPVVKEKKVESPKRSSSVVASKKKQTANNVASRKPKSYHSESYSYQPQLSAEEMYIKGKEYYNNKDYFEAIKLFRNSAELGNAAGQNSLGVMFREGSGVSRDYSEAIKWFRKSAEQGNAKGQGNLGWMYHNGYGVSQDYSEAVKWYRKSAEQGNENAKNNLRILNETW